MTDPEGDTLSVKGVRLVDTHGHPIADQSSIVDNGDGTFTFSPTAAMAASHQSIRFEYDVSDGTNTIAVKAHGAVDPVQHFHAFEGSHAAEDTVFDATGHLTASKTDGTALQFAAGTFTGGKYGGSLELHADGSYTYHLTPAQMQASNVQALAQGHWGYDQFTVNDSDGHAHNFHVRIAGADDAATIQVDSGSDQEVIDKESATVTATGQLSIHDVDNSGVADTFLAKNFIAGSYGHMQLDPNGQYTYVLDNANAKVLSLSPTDQITDHLTVETKDGVTQQVSITIHGADDAPVIAAIIAQQTSKGAAQLSGQIDATDPDLGDTITFRVAHGQTAPAGFVLQSDGSYTFNPSDVAYQGVVAGTKQLITIPIEAIDGSGQSSVKDLIITVSGGNSAPTADAHIHIADLSEDTTVTFNERSLLNLAHAADADHDQLHVTRLSVDARIGTISDDGRGHFTFTPTKDFNGDNIDFSFKVSDGQTTTTVHASGDIKAVNDPSTVDPFTLGSIQEEGAKHFSAQDLLAHAHDVEGDTLTLDGAPTVDGRYGTITGDASTGFTFTPAANYFGKNVPIHFAVTDGTDVTQADTHIDVQGVADKATFVEVSGQHVQEDTKYIAQGQIDVHDADGASQEHFVASNNIQGTYGYLAIGLTGNWSYHLNKNHVAGVQGLADGEKYVEHFTLHSADGSAHILNVEILGTQDTAQITGTAAASINEDTSEVTGKLTMHDKDTSENHFTADNNMTGSFGHLEIAANGAYKYVLDNGSPTVQALQNGDTRTETFTITSPDGSASKDIVITVQGQNDAPVVSSAVVLPSGTEDTATTITAAQLLANASDVDTGDTLSIDQLTVDHGSVTVSGSGTWQYTPEPDYNGDVQFSYKVVDAHHGETAASATMTLSAVNDAPTVTPTSASTTEDVSGGLIITEAELLAGSSDVDHDTLSVKNLSIPAAQGTLTDNGDGTWTLQPSANFNGDITLSYQVSDGNQDVSNQMTVSVSSVVDAASVATSSAPTGNEDTAIALNLNVQEHGDALESVLLSGYLAGSSFSAGQSDGHGGWIVNATDVPGLTITPPQDYAGTMNISVTATTSDGSSSAQSSAQSISIEVKPIADSAVITGADSAAITEDAHVQASGMLETGAQQLSITDPDANEAMFQVSGASAGGTGVNEQGSWVAGDKGLGEFKVNADGSWLYRADNSSAPIQGLGNGETLKETLTVHSIDGTTHVITASILGTNDAPTVHTQVTSINIDEGNALHMQVPSDAFVDAEGDSISIAATLASGDPLPAWLHFDKSTGLISGTPAHANDGDIQIKLTATDPDGASSSQTFHINVMNKSADVVEDGRAKGVDYAVNGQLETYENNQQIVWHEKADGSDPSHGQYSGTYGAMQLNQAGTWIYHVDHDGQAHYVNSAINALKDGEVVQESFTMYGFVGGNLVKTDTVTIHVVGTNDAATINGSSHSSSSASITEDDTQTSIDGALNLTDVDHGEDQFAPITHQAGTYGEFELAADGHWTYKLDNSLAATQALSAKHGGTETFTVSSPDGTATHTLTINITGTNDAPTISASSIAAIEDSDHSFTASEFGFNDVDTGDQLDHLTITTLPDPLEGSLSLNGQAVLAGQEIPASDITNLVFTPSKDFHGDVDFKYTVNDGKADSSESTATLSVANVDDAPELINPFKPVDLGSTNEDSDKTFTAADLLANVHDADGDVLSLKDVSVDPQFGTLSDDGHGNYTFHPKADYYGSDIPIHYTATDGTHDVSGSAQIDVQAVTDGPKWDGHMSFTKAGDGTWTIDMSVGAGHGGIDTAYGEEVQHLYLRGFLKGTVVTDGTHTWTQTQDNLQSDAWKDPAHSNPDGIKGYNADSNTQHTWVDGHKVDTGVTHGVTDQMANQHALDIAGWDWSNIQITVPPGTYSHAYTWAATEYGKTGTTQGSVTFNSGDHHDSGTITEDADHDIAGFIDAHPSDGVDVDFKAAHLDGKFGHLDLQADGQWKYTLDETKANHLNDGDTEHDVFHVQTTNGDSHDIALDILGHTDTAPAVSPGVIAPPPPPPPAADASDEPSTEHDTAQGTVTDVSITFIDEPQLNLSSMHRDASHDKSVSVDEAVDQRAASVFGGAAENEANDALQSMIEDHLSAHQKAKPAEPQIDTSNGTSGDAANADAQNSESASQDAHAGHAVDQDSHVGGSSSSHLDSLVSKPDDDSLPPI